MVDIAFDMLTKKKKALTFLKLWEEAAELAQLSEQQKEDNIAQFYTDVSLDDRFVHVGDNKWDLRSRHTYKEVVINTSDLMIEDNDDDEEVEAEEEETKSKEDDYN